MAKKSKDTAKKPKGRQAGTQLRSFVFTGDKIGGDDPESIEVFGYVFKLNGKAVKVAAPVAEKLSNHSHFTEK